MSARVAPRKSVAAPSALRLGVVAALLPPRWLPLAQCFTFRVLVASRSSPVTGTQYVGYGIAFLAVAYYNYSKFQAAKAANSAKNSRTMPERAKLLDNEAPAAAGKA